jgi:hypothetical protein
MYGPVAADGSQLKADRRSKDIQGTADCGLRTANLSIAPNPFSRTTLVTYSLPEAGSVSLRLYDVTGKLVTALASGYYPAGSFRYSLLTTRHSLAGGIYLLRLESAGFQATQKLIVE